MGKMRILAGFPLAVGAMLILAAIWKWVEVQSFVASVRIMLAGGLALATLGFFVFKRLKLAAEVKDGFPAEDEFSQRIKYRAGHAAFYLSMFLWMAIFLFHQYFDKPQTMLGVGILGQAALYGISILHFRRSGVDDGKSP